MGDLAFSDDLIGLLCTWSSELQLKRWLSFGEVEWEENNLILEACDSSVWETDYRTCGGQRRNQLARMESGLMSRGTSCTAQDYQKL